MKICNEIRYKIAQKLCEFKFKKRSDALLKRKHAFGNTIYAIVIPNKYNNLIRKLPKNFFEYSENIRCYKSKHDSTFVRMSTKRPLPYNYSEITLPKSLQQKVSR